MDHRDELDTDVYHPSQAAGYTGTISVGRVQTPTTALVVRRELAIRNFKPQDYYVLHVDFSHANGIVPTVWEPENQGEERRILKRSTADQVLGEVQHSQGTVELVEQKKGQQQQKLPYSLSALQIDAGKIFGYLPQEVLDTQQSLYEKSYFW